MNLYSRAILVAGILAAMAGSLLADPVLTLFPTGNLSGIPGSTVGWGWSLTNDTPYHLEFSSSQFCVNPVILIPGVVCNSASTGMFQDIIVGNDPIIPPNSTTLVENFDPAGFTTGLGYFTIDPSALLGSSDLGQIVLVYDGYDGDPTTCSNCTQQLFSVPLAADASVTVTTPEPSSAWAVELAVILTFAAVRFRVDWRARLRRECGRRSSGV